MSNNDEVEQLSIEFCHETWQLLSKFMTNHKQLVGEYQKVLASQQDLIHSNEDLLEKLRLYKDKYKTYFNNEKSTPNVSLSLNSTIEIAPQTNVQQFDINSSSLSSSFDTLSEDMPQPPLKIRTSKNVILKESCVKLEKLGQDVIDRYLSKQCQHKKRHTVASLTPDPYDFDNEDTENGCETSVKSTPILKKSRKTNEFKLDRLFRSQNPNVSRKSTARKSSATQC